MSNRAHSGRCFRASRATKARKLRQGKTWERPIRWKVPLALRPFLNITPGSPNQRMATFDIFALCIEAHNKHRELTGKGPRIVADGGDVVAGA